MKLNIIVESKCFKEQIPDLHDQLLNNPCNLCIMGQGMMCVERKYCRWKTHEEIYVKQKVEVLK